MQSQLLFQAWEEQQANVRELPAEHKHKNIKLHKIKGVEVFSPQGAHKSLHVIKLFHSHPIGRRRRAVRKHKESPVQLLALRRVG